jgi:peptide methionine sulfoxide reductase msrA/msrB
MIRILKGFILILLIFPVSPGLSAYTKTDMATFAGGCFWCMQPPFEKLNGVIEVIAGYTGGRTENPTYKEVESGTTGHVEAIQVTYDPSKITYLQLLDVYWRQINPTDSGGQFVDRGAQYRSVIFYHNDEQKKLAETTKHALDASAMFDRPIMTDIVQAAKFYKAEEYHQDYYKKNPVRYEFYRYNSGRDHYIEKAWADDKLVRFFFPRYTEKNYKRPSHDEMKMVLTPLQYEVTQKGGTEQAFKNTYWNNERQGIYVDLISGEPLFSSLDKYDSHTGWPSYTKPMEPGNIVEKEDKSLFTVRTEVLSKHAGSHLGHVFHDGPPPKGLRYCMDSAALLFIPKEDLVKEGYGKYLKLFEK